jgi:hypothetical protein
MFCTVLNSFSNEGFSILKMHCLPLSHLKSISLTPYLKNSKQIIKEIKSIIIPKRKCTFRSPALFDFTEKEIRYWKRYALVTAPQNVKNMSICHHQYSVFDP